MSKRKIGSLIAALLLLGAVFLAGLNAQYLRDVARYYQYDAPETVASFVDQSGMNDRGKFLFYTSHPSLETADTFNQRCERREKTAAILGCYDGQRIFIYDITDERLAGIRPTTAAHEMLHAAYRRLSSDDKRMVDELVTAEHARLLDNKELADRMAFYAVSQPGEEKNELHSIIATEFAAISPELESYYKRYFTDRSKVVALHMQYSSIFDELQSRAETLSARIDSLSTIVQDKRALYNAEAEALQRDIASFNTRANGGDFSNQSAFASERRSLVARSANIDKLRDEINGLINEYNSLVIELNSIALETNNLNRSLDSTIETAPSI